MKCFNCGDEANMKVLVVINGKAQKVDICQKCYKEQMDEMVEQMRQNGQDSEQLQKFMFNLFKDNKEEFEKLLGDAFNMPDLNIDDLEIEEVTSNLFKGSEETINFKDFLEKNRDMEYINDMDDEGPNMGWKEIKSDREKEDRRRTRIQAGARSEITFMKNTVARKRKQLDDYVRAEDYLQAASIRDQIRDMNKEIMILKEVEKANER